MPRKLDDILGQAGAPGTVTDTELADLKKEIVRDVTATLMFGELPTPRSRNPARLEQAASTLQDLCRAMLRDDEAAEHLTRIADSPTDPEGAVRFACLLDLAKKPDGALWWWQFAAGAGNATAAYCLYLFHTRRGDLRDAAHWWYQHRALGPDLDLPLTGIHTKASNSSKALRQAVARLRVEEAAGEFHHPDHRLADQIEDLVNCC